MRSCVATIVVLLAIHPLLGACSSDRPAEPDAVQPATAAEPRVEPPVTPVVEQSEPAPEPEAPIVDESGDPTTGDAPEPEPAPAKKKPKQTSSVHELDCIRSCVKGDPLAEFDKAAVRADCEKTCRAKK